MTYRVSPLGDFAVLGQKSFDQKFAGLTLIIISRGQRATWTNAANALVQDLLAGKHELLREGIV
jgi:hypothetical protein